MTRRKNTKSRTLRRRGGHPFMVLFFFLALIMGAAYMTDRMTNAPDSQVAQNVTTIGHLFNDKEMQGLVPKEDQGTPESVKEKIKAAMDKVVTVNVKADDEVPAASSSTAKAAGKTDTGTAPAKEKTASFSLPAIVSKITGKSESSPADKAETGSETKTVVASRSGGAAPAGKETASRASQASASNGSSKVISSKDSKEAASASAGSSAKGSSTGSSAVSRGSKGNGTPVAVKAAAPAAAPKPNTPSTVKGRLAVVIDDAGRDLASQHVYESMGIPLTLAVMPNQVHTRDAALSWHAHGLPVILHQPMESVSGIGMEQKVILTSMSDEAIRSMLKDSLSQVPEAVGINNHQGSKATIDRRTMDVVMNELHHRHLFFFDSRTNSTTAADGAAAAYGVPYVRNDLFVDNEADVAAFSAMIREAANRAEKYGTYVIIGHCRPKTAEAFRQMVPKLKAEGIQFVYVSSLAK
ncbi:divergent polysaccharide deacetylase family protein [uncultured Dialister sp.]|uniref:divergent polysaccharide deacetylase family protein n=1 Tax=uncultured Dialister sp. TaxID=278064 RepID=UPI0026DC8850|nr:divergent polysaccharide deacetylase family protein [uncultured Dialister sp.]